MRKSTNWSSRWKVIIPFTLNWMKCCCRMRKFQLFFLTKKFSRQLKVFWNSSETLRSCYWNKGNLVSSQLRKPFSIKSSCRKKKFSWKKKRLNWSKLEDHWENWKKSWNKNQEPKMSLKTCQRTVTRKKQFRINLNSLLLVKMPKIRASILRRMKKDCL